MTTRISDRHRPHRRFTLRDYSGLLARAAEAAILAHISLTAWIVEAIESALKRGRKP